MNWHWLITCYRISLKKVSSTGNLDQVCSSGKSLKTVEASNSRNMVARNGLKADDCMSCMMMTHNCTSYSFPPVDL